MSDQDSHPSTYELSHAESILSQRMIGKPMSPAAKRRVDRATCSNPELSRKHCLVENTGNSNDIEYFHCLPRLTDERFVTFLYWNLIAFNYSLDPARQSRVCVEHAAVYAERRHSLQRYSPYAFSSVYIPGGLLTFA